MLVKSAHGTLDPNFLVMAQLLTCFNTSMKVSWRVDLTSVTWYKLVWIEPNVNWKFYDNLKTMLFQEFDTKLINIGSCGLHMPLKFVGHRRLENVPVYERAITVWGSVELYVKAVKDKKVSKHDKNTLQ